MRSPLGGDFADFAAGLRRWWAGGPFEADACVMLSSADLDGATVDALADALVRRPRPFAVVHPTSWRRGRAV